MGGIGFWKDTERVKTILARFGVAEIVDVNVMLTADFAQLYRSAKMPPVDLLLIDADHSYEGFRYDFETYSSFVSDNGLILCHDTEVNDDGVVQRSSEFEAVSLPVWPGLGIVRKRSNLRRRGVFGWRTRSYLTSPAIKVRGAYRSLPLPPALRLKVETAYGRTFSYTARRRWQRRATIWAAKRAATLSGMVPGFVRRLVPDRIKRGMYHHRGQ
jgi:hypothetical protein